MRKHGSKKWFYVWVNGEGLSYLYGIAKKATIGMVKNGAFHIAHHSASPVTVVRNGKVVYETDGRIIYPV